MYVDSSEACNKLSFQLGTTGVGTGLATRQWSIKVTQYSCDFPNLAPDGCTQWYFGSGNQQIQTFNFDGGQHLANQDHNMCIRRERGMCRICYATQANTDFAVSSLTTGVLKLQAAVSSNPNELSCFIQQNANNIILFIRPRNVVATEPLV